MAHLDDKSVVIIKSVDPKNKGFGTGFIIHKDAEDTYVLTCAHVIKEVVSETNPNRVIVENYDGKVYKNGEPDNIDLALVRIEKEHLAGSCLKLKPEGQEGKPFKSVGWVRYLKGLHSQREIERFEGKLTDSTDFEGKRKEQRIKGWKIKIDRKVDEEKKLEQGCSGAPIVDDQSGSVIGVITSMVEPENIEGRAIDIGELLNLWQDIPESLKTELVEPKPPLPEDDDFAFEGEVYAFLVGIDTYNNGVKVKQGQAVDLKPHEVPDLNFCINDVQEFKKFLITHKVEPSNIIDLVEKEETYKSNILIEFNKFIKKVNKKNNDPLVLIFFACHGYPHENENYLFPYDGNRSYLDDTSISYKSFKERLKQIKTSNLVVFLDSCHSGGLTERGKRGTDVFIPLKNLEESGSYHIIASCKANQYSKEEYGHGIFTRELLNLLKNSYSAISDASITTVNLIPPLVEKVKEKTNDGQEPTANFKVENRGGILLGKNIRRTEEIKKERKKEYPRKRLFLDRIDPIIEKKRPKFGIDICDLLENYIEGKDPHEKYMNFYNAFDQYSKIYEEKDDNIIIDNRVDGILRRYDKCREQHKISQKPEQVESDAKLPLVKVEPPSEKKIAEDPEMAKAFKTLTGTVRANFTGPSRTPKEDVRELKEDQQKSILCHLEGKSAHWFRMKKLLEEPLSQSKVYNEIYKLRKEINKKIENRDENEEELKNAIELIDKAMEQFDKEWISATKIEKEEKFNNLPQFRVGKT